jgi:hypothetical protein
MSSRSTDIGYASPVCAHSIRHIRQHTSAYVSIRQHTSAYMYSRSSDIGYASPVCAHTSAYVSIRQHTSAYVSIRQHLSIREAVISGTPRLFARIAYVTYVSIRQHTSAYVSIRQHTSAYVSIRQHTSSHIRFREAVISSDIGCALTDLSADNFARHVVVCAVLSAALPVSIYADVC